MLSIYYVEERIQEKKKETLYILLSSNLISLRFQPPIKVLYLTSVLSTRARRSEDQTSGSPHQRRSRFTLHRYIM